MFVSRESLSYFELPDDSLNIFRKSNIDHYMEIPSATFCIGKGSVLNKFCQAELFAHCIFENKN